MNPGLLNILYFILGFFACVMTALGWVYSSERGKEKKPVKSRTWTKLETIEYNSSFDYEVGEGMTGAKMAEVIGHALILLIRKRPGDLATMGVAPAKYTIRLTALARLVKREENDNSTTESVVGKAGRN